MAGAKGIRGRVAALGRRGRGAKLPEDLREEIADYARRRRERGGRVRDIAVEVGVSRESIRRWSSTSSSAKATVVPVRIRPDHAATQLVVVTPGGVRIEGLDLEQAAELVRRLG